MTLPSLDIQLGNHDGSLLRLCFNTIRIAARYGNLALLQDGYGNLSKALA